MRRKLQTMYSLFSAWKNRKYKISLIFVWLLKEFKDQRKRLNKYKVFCSELFIRMEVRNAMKIGFPF